MSYAERDKLIDPQTAFEGMQPGVWCACCQVLAKQEDDYLCRYCREDLEDDPAHECGSGKERLYSLDKGR